ncbi:MAG: hypothetical protein WDM79_15475 [Terricaulis sp.]
MRAEHDELQAEQFVERNRGRHVAGGDGDLVEAHGAEFSALGR